MGVLHLLIDTCALLDLARDHQGRRLIEPLRNFQIRGWVDVLVPQVIVDEFDRNKPAVEASMTRSVSDRFKFLRSDLIAHGLTNTEALRQLDELAHEIPIVGAMATRNFLLIRELLDRGTKLIPSAAEHQRVVERGLGKIAPLHRDHNSVADALLIELYATALAAAEPDDQYAFVTSNPADFSVVGGDKRQPHSDIAELFAATNSTYCLGINGLQQLLSDHLFDELSEFLDESAFIQDEPRGLDEILAAHQELFDKIWYDRSMSHEQRLLAEGNDDKVEELRRVAGPGRARVESTYNTADLGPYDKFEWGMLNGKLSALRWLLGDDWDSLDT